MSGQGPAATPPEDRDPSKPQGVERRRAWRPPSMTDLRQSPIRNGLIGLAVVGVATPLAVSRYQHALRLDPSHESITARIARDAGADEHSVATVWQEMEAQETTLREEREAAIREHLERHAELGLSRELAEAIYDVAAAHEIEPEVAFGLVRAESSFKNSATSPVGAVGLTQLMPRTAAWLEPGITIRELRNPQTNLRIGFRYLRDMLDKYNGDTKLALLAYNRGPGTVDRELRNGRNPDNGYADFVFGKEDHGHTLFTRR